MCHITLRKLRSSSASTEKGGHTKRGIPKVISLNEHNFDPLTGMGLRFGFLRQLLVGVLCLAYFCCFDQMLLCLSFLLRLYWSNVDLGFEEAQELQKGIQRRRWKAQIP